MKNQSNYKEAFNILEEYCEKKRWALVLKHNVEDTAELSTRVIKIGKRKNFKISIFCLLHEIGHFLIYENTLNYDQKYCVDNKPKTLKRIITVAEEFEAWGRGKRLAEKLVLPINFDDYERTAARYLISYCRWAVEK